MTKIAGYKEVDVEKDTTHCKWLIKAPGRDIVLYEVSWRYAYDWENVTEEYYTCIYTALLYSPLSDADREALFKLFPTLRFRDELEVDESDRPSVQSNTPPPRPKAEEKATKTPEKVSFKRKVDV